MNVTPAPKAVLGTPFHRRTSALCDSNCWGRWAGYTTPEVYSLVEMEYFAIRNAATLCDISPMIKYRIDGPDAAAYLNRVMTRDVAKLATGRVGYTLWCNGAGHVLDDGTLFRLGEQSFQLCAQERHLEWLLDSAAGYDVIVADETEAIAAVALQGPTSCAVLQAMGLEGIELLRPFALRSYDLEGHELLVSRTGFTGDLGYELWVRPQEAEELWDRLVQAGRRSGIRPVGTQTLDLARIEAGFIMTNTDFMAAGQALRHTRGRSPFELGLGWLVNFDKGHFNGRRALLEEKRRGSRYTLVGLDIEGNKPAAGALIYHRRKKEVGHVTSAMWSPTCKANIALASLQRPYGDSITENLWVEIYVLKELKWDKVMARCKVVPRPFFDPPRRRATPALDY